jgi:competence protein ComEC
MFLRVGMVVSEEEPLIFNHLGEEVLVYGTVVSDPERRATSLHAYVEVIAVGRERADGVVLGVLSRAEELQFGDRVVLQGTLERPEAFVGDTGRLFDYPSYLKAKGVDARMPFGELVYVEPGSMSPQKFLFVLKHSFERSIEALLPEPHASLGEGVLLGTRRGLSEDLNQAFVVSGLIHIVVLSGYNIAIVADYVLRLLSVFLPRRLALMGGGVGIVLFALMTGAGATTVRASIMGLIAILARYLERPAAAMRALILAAALMALWNPLAIFHDPSFILSVIATFGLITLSPWVETFLKWVPERFGLRSIAASTIAVQLYILPALLYMTGVLSLVSLPANFLALPVVPLAMLGTFFAGLLGLVHSIVALPFTMLAEVFLKWIMFVAQGAASLPFSSTVVPPFPLWLAVLVYIPLTTFAVRMYVAEQNKLSGDSRSRAGRERANF